MKPKISNILVPLAAVIGFGLAITASSATAEPAWDSPKTLFEDDNVDFLIKGEGNTQSGIIEVGDVVASVIEFNESAGAPIQPEELTGLAILEVAAILNLDGSGGANDIVFRPAALGFDSYSGIAPLPDGTGTAGSGGMLALWLDGSPDLDIEASTISVGSPSCTTYAGCVAQATNGDSWLVAGLGTDPDNSWVALNVPLDTGILDITNPSIVLGRSNASLSVLLNNTGQILIPNNISCAPLCGPSGDGKADMIAGLSFKGGGESIISSEWFATSDLDMVLSSEPQNPDIDIEKLTNGVDADDPNAGDAPEIAPGDTVTWTYVVTNIGNVPLQNVTVTDDQGAAVSCPQTTLEVGESMNCTASGVADDLNNTSFTTVPGLCGGFPETPLYENMGKATGNSATGEFVEDEDPSHYCNPPLLACRFTGGGVDTDLNWDGTLEDGTMRRGNGAGNLPDAIDRYQMGGQAGANTGAQPQPKGEWTHHQQTGPSGSFTFHAGTASAPAGTEIDLITCSDPNHCVHAREAPAKQLDFEGIGTFRTVGRGRNAPVWGLDDQNQEVVLPFTVNVDTGHGNRGYNGTYHWFEVNIDDLGEPRVENTTPIEGCPTLGFGVNGDPGDPLNVEPADCGCPDFYRIKIYNGVYADESGDITPDKTHLIYEAYGYIDGGNLQIHPPTGFDRK
jgi:plastocyanin